MDDLKGKFPIFKVIDKQNEHCGEIIEATQWGGMETMYDAKINGFIYAFHITQLEYQYDKK